MDPIRVSLVEDVAAFRATTARLIAATPGLACVSSHPNAEHALRHLPEAHPDVALVDIELLGRSGIECVRELRGVMPGLLIIMLTGHANDDYIFQSLQAGAVGYVLKRAGADAILGAIRDVAAGGSPMTPEIARRVALHFRHDAAQAAVVHGLTPREFEVLQLLARGKAPRDIADQLHVALPTVNNHLRHIYEKLHVSSRMAAVAKVFPR